MKHQGQTTSETISMVISGSMGFLGSADIRLLRMHAQTVGRDVLSI